MNWLIQLANKSQPEIWSDEKIELMQQKCDYYGAKPSWVKLKPAIEIDGNRLSLPKTVDAIRKAS